MKSRFDGFNWVVRLEKGELLVQSLTKFIRSEGIKGGFISGLGGAAWAELGFYDLPSKEYRWQKFDQLLEITSLQGNVAWEGDEPVLHIHSTLSDKDMRTFGGHIKELEVGGTCEIFLHGWFRDKLTRSQEDQTGLKLLDL